MNCDQETTERTEASYASRSCGHLVRLRLLLRLDVGGGAVVADVPAEEPRMVLPLRDNLLHLGEHSTESGFLTGAPCNAR